MILDFLMVILKPEIINENISVSNTYTVPIGKTLYITNAKVYGQSGVGHLKIDNVDVLTASHFGYSYNQNVLIAKSNSVISSNNPQYNLCNINGYLVDENVDYNENISVSNIHTVPIGKTLYITNAKVYGQSGVGHLKIDNVDVLTASHFDIHITKICFNSQI